MSAFPFKRCVPLLAMLLCIAVPVAGYDSYDPIEIDLEDRSYSDFVLRAAFATTAYQDVEYLEEWDNVARLQFEAVSMSPYESGLYVAMGLALTFTLQDFEGVSDDLREGSLDYWGTTVRYQLGPSYTSGRWRSELFGFLGGGFAILDGSITEPGSEAESLDEVANLFEYGVSWNLMYTARGGWQFGGGLDWSQSIIRGVDEFNKFGIRINFL